jgi:deoxyribodipyrimidine photolyase-related protein
MTKAQGDGCRNLVVVLGDQLNEDASGFDDFDLNRDAVWMCEAVEEATHVWSSKQRIAVFLSAMRHFAEVVRGSGKSLHYRYLDAPGAFERICDALADDLAGLKPERIVVTAPGDWRILQALKAVAEGAAIQLEVREDRHFYCTVRDFVAHMQRRKSVRLEFFYRELRQRFGVLMQNQEPIGGRWNFDTENREAFDKTTGPGELPKRGSVEQDAITQDVIRLVESRFADHPGQLASFAWPVTRESAQAALHRFIAERLPLFGRYEDAMWPGEPWLYHSHLSSSLNLKLLHPHEVVQAAETAFHQGLAPIESVEGFVRQILGWREYVRGIYWSQMPGYLERNALAAHEPLPDWYWTGDTQMACLREVITQTLTYGYAHHIQRLMVTGLYALLLGVDPKRVHEWYLAVYVDAVEWVELPNTLGMSQYADGGMMASKPYVASGKYIQRMGGPCKTCRYDPAKKVGDKACPFTTLYWDFLMRHETSLASNPRMVFQVKNVSRLKDTERREIRQQAMRLRSPDSRPSPPEAFTLDASATDV